MMGRILSDGWLRPRLQFAPCVCSLHPASENHGSIARGLILLTSDSWRNISAPAYPIIFIREKDMMQKLFSFFRSYKTNLFLKWGLALEPG